MLYVIQITRDYFSTRIIRKQVKKMKIAIFSKHPLISEMMTHYFSSLGRDMNIYSYYPEEMGSLRKVFDYIILNNLCQFGDITAYVQKAQEFVKNRKNLILINGDHMNCHINGFTVFSGANSLQDLTLAITSSSPSPKDMSRPFSMQEMISHMPRSSQLQNDFSDLTRHQKDILGFLLTNMDYTVIADHFGISINTLKKHNTNIFKKMNVRSRNELQKLLIRSAVLSESQT